jgi:hypothetical protein
MAFALAEEARPMTPKTGKRRQPVYAFDQNAPVPQGLDDVTMQNSPAAKLAGCGGRPGCTYQRHYRA